MTRTTLIALFFSLLFFFGCNPDTSEKVNYKYNDNTVRVRLAKEPDALNPLHSYLRYSRMVYELMYMELLDFDPESLEMTPQLVKSNPTITEITEGEFKGGTAFEYELREEAKWDDGSPITAEDVNFSIKMILSQAANPAYLSYYEYVKDFEIDSANPRKFTVYTDEKYMLNEAAISNTFVVQESLIDPEGVLKKYSVKQLNSPEVEEISKSEELQKFIAYFRSAKFGSDPEGVNSCGPYKFEVWESGQFIRLTKKKDWWGEKVKSNSLVFAAEPDTLIFKIIPDQAASMNAMIEGEIDVANSIDSEDFVNFRDNAEAAKNYNLSNPSTSAIFFVAFNMKNPKLSDVRVRRALAHLMDVDDFLKNFYNGFGERITVPIPNHAPYHNNNLPPINLDVEKAKTLVTEAGWADSDNDGFVDKEGENLSLEILIPGSKASENIASILQTNMKKLGIETTVKSTRKASRLSRMKDFEIYVGARGLDIGLVELKQDYHSESDVPGGSNIMGFGSEKTDALIDELRVTLDEEKRNKLYKEVQAEIYNAQPAIYLFSPKERLAIHKRFEAKTTLKRPTFQVNAFKLKE